MNNLPCLEAVSAKDVAKRTSVTEKVAKAGRRIASA